MEEIPCIVDDDGPNGEQIVLFESGSILVYLAEKVPNFIPKKTSSKEWRFAIGFFRVGPRNTCGFGGSLASEREGCGQRACPLRNLADRK